MRRRVYGFGAGLAGVLGALVCLLTLPRSACALEEGRCLPPQVGQRLEAFLGDADLATVLQGGATVDDAQVSSDRIRLQATAPDGAGWTLELLAEAAAPVDERGRWFGFRLPAGATAPERARALALARWLDGRFPDDPWVTCDRPDDRRSEILAEAGPWRSPLVRLGLLGGVLVALIALAAASRTARAAGQRLAAGIDRRAWLWLAGLLVAMGAARLWRLDIPFDGDYATQRAFFASLDLGDILAHRYDDSRHPQLFYLILHGFLWFGHEHWLLRLPAVVFSLTAAVALFVLARRYLGNARALAPVAVLALSAPFLSHSRDVSDVTLFLTLAILSWDAFLRSAERPTRARLAFLALVEVGMLYSYYMSVLVVAAQVGALVLVSLRGRARELAPVWLALGVAMIAGLPFWRDFVALVGSDQDARLVAAAFPHHLWGERQAGEFAAELATLLFPPGWSALPVVLALGLGFLAWCRRYAGRAEGWLVLGLGLCAGLVIGAGVYQVRLKPYYVIYLLPLAALLTTFGVLGAPRDPAPPARSRYPWGWVARSAFGVAVLAALAVGWLEGAHSQYEANPRAAYGALSDRLKAEGPLDTLVADPDCLHTILLYYTFPSPLEAYRTCTRAGDMSVRCEHEGRRLVTLTSMPRMAPGWEARSLDRFRDLRRAPLWFVYTLDFENPPLHDELRGACALIGTFGRLELYRCPAVPPL